MYASSKILGLFFFLNVPFLSIELIYVYEYRIYKWKLNNLYKKHRRQSLTELDSTKERQSEEIKALTYLQKILLSFFISVII